MCCVCLCYLGLCVTLFRTLTHDAFCLKSSPQAFCVKMGLYFVICSRKWHPWDYMARHQMAVLKLLGKMCHCYWIRLSFINIVVWTRVNASIAKVLVASSAQREQNNSSFSLSSTRVPTSLGKSKRFEILCRVVRHFISPCLGDWFVSQPAQKMVSQLLLKAKHSIFYKQLISSACK